MPRKKALMVLFLIVFSLYSLYTSSIVNVQFNNDNLTEFNHGNIRIPLNSQPDINFSLLPPIDYQSLNESWYDPKIEMLIITPDGNQAFVNACKPLMDWKNEKGVKTIILSNYSSYAGVDNAEKVRNMIKSYCSTENIKWVLLAADAGNGANEIPIREVYNPDVVVLGQSEWGTFDDYYKPTDFYYADLNDTWDQDGDGNWGESKINNSNGFDEISWNPDVYVGRLPANDATELGIMINKTLKYETNPLIGDWMNKMLLAGGVASYVPNPEDETRLTEYIWKNYTLPVMNFTTLNRTTADFTPEIPPAPNIIGDLTQANFTNNFNSGFSTIVYAGFGDPTQLNDAAGVIYTNAQASSCNNNNMTSLFYASATTTAPYDQSDNNIGEILIKRSEAGAIGYIGALRTTWYFEDDDNLEKLNRGNAKLFWKEFFEEKKFQQGKALYDSKVTYLNSPYLNSGLGSIEQEWERKNLLTYSLLGDPELDIYTNTPLSIRNPFPQGIYEGHALNVPILNMKNESIPYARVHLRTSDGKYRTFYADEEGNCTINLPVQADEKYNVTITGHNVIPSYFNFTTLADNQDPEIHNITIISTNPPQNSSYYFTVNTTDNAGIENAFLVISDDNFTTYSINTMDCISNHSNIFNYSLYNLTPGNYSYLVIARDFANNTKMLYDDSYKFKVPDLIPPKVIINTPLPGASFGPDESLKEVEINATITDAESFIFAVKAIINGTNAFNLSMNFIDGEWICIWNNLSHINYNSGFYSITIWAIDVEGNINATESVNITLIKIDEIGAGNDDDDKDDVDETVIYGYPSIYLLIFTWLMIISVVYLIHKNKKIKKKY